MKTAKVLSLFAWLMLVLFGAGVRAQQTAEPTVQQIYQAASSGDVRGAREMIDQVIARHPGSAKAHYVKAELAARDRDAATARTELQTAEKLSPGLPFARPEAVSALRSQLETMTAPAANPRSEPSRPGVNRMGAPPAESARAAGAGFPMGALLTGAILIGGLFLLLRRRRAAQSPLGAPLSPEGRRGFDPAPAPGYGPATGQAGPYDPMGQPQQGAMGSSLMRGVGTGLAVGAGVVVAQEIGRRLFDHGNEAGPGRDPAAGHGAADSQIARDAGLGAMADPLLNQDMGGQDFGIADGGWDDGGGVDMGDAGGDWDNA